MASTASKDRTARIVAVIHTNVFKATKGRLLGKFFGMPALMLTTTGRKSGQKRSTMLTAPVVEGDKVVLVASYGGDDRDPAWYRNLVANPEVEVLMGGRNRVMQARVATDDEKAELWPRIVESYKGYAQYQTKTDRDIPVVILEP
jgi:deazaflavin-dependent oxidoreductase (nitroreductase family)